MITIMAKKQRKIEILTVMSWENEYHNGEWLRAIALCDSANYFEVAINCMRDGSMGEKDGNGVYERKWWSDTAGEAYDDRDLRGATKQEVALYKQYCPEQFQNGTWIDGEMRVRIIAEVDDRYGHHVIRELLPPVWWKRLWKYIRNIGKDNSLPF